VSSDKNPLRSTQTVTEAIKCGVETRERRQPAEEILNVLTGLPPLALELGKKGHAISHT
jgi:hypothetical protein